ncbi:hypothetical protein UREG_05950 [Uncinocarpus reesii 1704]|uniref:Uncharacterized protein n=1 Tax=Uncinocarpus reesii (strain UAMH 1704) TaxID=336963 RepID=C4JU11_UNCRE|nr:uncharacterized protein UREG_05950 [Uncinocarpus reesii 1704]EEP81108.1 hypothetical protein UREG_05950 [Uncinocarpus reesii 1704]
MQSTNPDNFFHTTASLEDSRRKAGKSGNKNGSPIKLPSKILAIAADPFNTDSVFVAESSGVLRVVALETSETTAIYRGPTAPLTSLCFSTDGRTVFAGCWDKSIWSWDVKTRKAGRKYVGHNDFVKAVLCPNTAGRNLLVSGGADADVLVWDISDGKILHVSQNHCRGIQSLAQDPVVTDDSTSITVFSAGSDRTILCFRIPINAGSMTVAESILEHETSVYKLLFDEDGDLWTASADKTAKCLARENGWKSELSMEHPDFVRDVAVHEAGGWVVTACRDEETGELHHTYSGHFEEVTGLVLLGTKVVSVSIDATIRQWSLRPEDIRQAKLEASGAAAEDEEPPRGQSMLTADEERELDELLNDD